MGLTMGTETRRPVFPSDRYSTLEVDMVGSEDERNSKSDVRYGLLYTSYPKIHIHESRWSFDRWQN